MNIQEAEKILNKYVTQESLLRHSRAVSAAMRYFARKFKEDEEKWAIVGLLHDFDYEQYPDEHPKAGESILREAGVPEEMIRAILSHANYTGVKRESLMEKTLYAVDELCGFVIAVAFVRPEKLEGMKVKSVKKKLKDRGFAAAVNREEIMEGAKELSMEQDELIAGVIEALYEARENLSLT